MKIAIIGAGHIGSAIVACLAKGHLYNEKDIIVANPNIEKTERLQKRFPAIHITTDNQRAVSEAEVIILAVNPWKADEVLLPLRFSRSQILISLVSGIAFALKYIQAAMQAGIELGIPAEDAMRMIAYSMEGATELILNHDTHPLLEIEKVATPGGITIKGLNELEHGGFTSCIIQAIKSSATALIDKNTEE